MQQTNTVLMLSQGTTDNLWHQFVSLPKGLPCSIWPMVVRTQSHPQEAQNRKPKCDFRGFLESSGIFSLPLFWVGFSFWGFWESLCESAMIFHFFLTEHRHALTPPEKETNPRYEEKKCTEDSKNSLNYTLGAYSLSPVGGTGVIQPWAKLILVTLSTMAIL